MVKLAEFSTKNGLLVNLISLFVIIAGTMSMFQLKREAFPPVDFNIVTISTSYPGAPAEDVEKFVTIPIEKEIKGISGIKEFTSSSAEGVSTIGITIDPDTTYKDQVVDDIKDAVDRVRNLPEGVEEDPIVFELKSKETPILELSISGDYPESELRQYAETLEDQLLDIKGVASINRIGWRDPEFWVEADADKLAQYYVSMDEIIEALNKRNVTLPGGQLTTDMFEYNVRITAEFTTAQEIQDVVIRANDSGKALFIKDVATVKAEFEDQTRIAKINRRPTVAMVVIKAEEGDVINVVREVNAVIDNFKSFAPDDLKFTITNDMSFYVNRRLGVLRNNGIIGFLLVLVLLFLFLDPIPALVTAFGIPIALLSTFMLMTFFGVTINLVSMLGLIIVLGMLVDDGIIVAENCYRYVEEGMDPKEAAIKGTQEVIAPVTVTILTTCAAFAPLLFMTDILGKFIREIPIVVMIALSMSLFEAFIILPSHIADFVKMSKPSSKGHKKPKQEKKWFAAVVNVYTNVLRWAVTHRYFFALFMVGILFSAIYIWQNHMKTILFTGEGIEQFYVRAEAENGTPLRKLNELINPVEEAIEHLPDGEVDAFRTYLGSIEEEGGFDPNAKAGTHLGQISVFLTPAQKRNRSPQEIADALRQDLNKIEGFEKLYVYLPKEGPPVGRDVSVGIKGEDYVLLQEMAGKYVQYLETIDGVSDIEIGYQFGKKQLKVVVNEQKAQRYGLTVEKIATTVRSAFRGGLATTIKPSKAEEEINVLVRLKEDQRGNLNAFDKILVENDKKNLVKLGSVAKIVEEDGVYTLNHLDGKRVVYVLANVDINKITSLEVNNMLQQKFAGIEQDYIGYNIKYSGEFEQQMESRGNLTRSFMIAFLIIFIILATMFNSIIQPLIVMLAIPFGLVGVIFAFYLHGRPMSFFGLMGVIGLTGIVVNDSIVLVDFINRLRKEGRSRRESLIEAGRIRLRPVLMTSITTIGGLVSVAYGIGGGDPFLKPMALAIVWGLFFSTALILVVIPCIYAIVDDFTEKILHKSMVKVDDPAAG